MLLTNRKVCVLLLPISDISLTSYTESGMLSLGETGEMSPNASAMLRICTLSAWAQLQVSSTQQGYLQKVVQPYRPVLASLWVASLRDYASIRVDSEFLHDTTSVAIDSSHSSLGKEVLLPVSTRVPHHRRIADVCTPVLPGHMGNHSPGRCHDDAVQRPAYYSCNGW